MAYFFSFFFWGGGGGDWQKKLRGGVAEEIWVDSAPVALKATGLVLSGESGNPCLQ